MPDYKKAVKQLEELVKFIEAICHSSSGYPEKYISRWPLVAIALLQTSISKTGDRAKFEQVALLVKALADIMKTPVLDQQGQLNPATATIQAKYRTLGGK